MSRFLLARQCLSLKALRPFTARCAAANECRRKLSGAVLAKGGPRHRVLKALFAPALTCLALYGVNKAYYLLHLDDRKSPSARVFPSAVLSIIDDSMHSMESATRLVRTMHVMTSLLVGYKVRISALRFLSRFDDSLKSDEEINRRLARYHEKGAKRLLSMFIRNGGVYVKFGQEVAACVGVLPQVYCRTMSTLYNSVPSVPFRCEISFFESLNRGQ